MTTGSRDGRRRWRWLIVGLAIPLHSAACCEEDDCVRAADLDAHLFFVGLAPIVSDPSDDVDLLVPGLQVEAALALAVGDAPLKSVLVTVDGAEAPVLLLDGDAALVELTLPPGVPEGRQVEILGEAIDASDAALATSAHVLVVGE